MSEPQCPLGYGSGKRTSADVGSSSIVECVLCRTFIYDMTKVIPCQCRYCHGCAIQLKDCLQCGRDVEGVERIADVDIGNGASQNSDEPRDHSASSNRKIEFILKAHLKSMSSCREQAIFILQMAARHERARNYHAALKRYEQVLEIPEDKDSIHLERAIALSKCATLIDMELSKEDANQQINNLMDTSARNKAVVEIDDKFRLAEHELKEALTSLPAVAPSVNDEPLQKHDQTAGHVLNAFSVLYSQWAYVLWNQRGIEDPNTSNTKSQAVEKLRQSLDYKVKAVHDHGEGTAVDIARSMYSLAQCLKALPGASVESGKEEILQAINELSSYISKLEQNTSGADLDNVESLRQFLSKMVQEIQECK